MTMEDTPTAVRKKGLFGGLLGGGKTYFVFALLAAIVAAGGALQLIGSATQTATYYVLNRPVAARTPITPAMLTPVATNVSGVPPQAMSLAQVESGNVFARVALRPGDVLSPSVAGTLTPISSGLPSNFVVASFEVNPQDAVAGLIRRGDYIDLIATSGGSTAGAEETAKVVLHHVLVLDVAVNPADIATAATSPPAGSNLNPGPASAAVHGGIPQMYTVALSPQDATTLALVRKMSLMVVLSANDSNSPAGASVQAQTTLGNVFTNAPVGNAGAGTTPLP